MGRTPANKEGTLTKKDRTRASKGKTPTTRVKDPQAKVRHLQTTVVHLPAYKGRTPENKCRYLQARVWKPQTMAGKVHATLVNLSSRSLIRLPLNEGWLGIRFLDPSFGMSLLLFESTSIVNCYGADWPVIIPGRIRTLYQRILDAKGRKLDRVVTMIAKCRYPRFGWVHDRLLFNASIYV